MEEMRKNKLVTTTIRKKELVNTTFKKSGLINTMIKKDVREIGRVYCCYYEGCGSDDGWPTVKIA